MDLYKKLRTWHEKGIHVCGHAAEQTKKQLVFRERFDFISKSSSTLQDLSETVLSPHDIHPTKVGVPQDGEEQQLDSKLHFSVENCREQLFTST